MNAALTNNNTSSVNPRQQSMMAAEGIGKAPLPATGTFSENSFGAQTTQGRDERPTGLLNSKYHSYIAGGISGDRSYNYEDKYPPDDSGQELGENARVWKVYLDEAEVYDDDMVKGFRDTIDSLLVFAALFSAVVTTFVVETSKALQPDYAQISTLLLLEQIKLLRANGNSTIIDSTPSSSFETTPSSNDVWVNGLFYTSLSLSLSTALLSVLAKQWLQAYTGVISGSAKVRALARQFRFSGLLKWNLPAIIGILPLLLHCSLAAFLIGLAVYVRSLHPPLSWSVIFISGLAFTFYLGSVFLPAVQINCPFRIPLLFPVAQYVIFPFRYCVYVAKRYLLSQGPLSPFTRPVLPSASLKAEELKTLASEIKFHSSEDRDSYDENGCQVPITCSAILWLHDISSNSTVGRISVKTIASLPRTCLSAFAKTRLADAVWEHIHSYKHPSSDDEKYQEVWIPAMQWMTPAMKQMARNPSNLVDWNLKFLSQVQNSKASATFLEILLACGADPNAVTKDHENGIILASTSGNLDAVKVLLANGANVNARGGKYGNALQASSIRGHLDVVKFLVEYGTDIDARGGFYGTALQAASALRHLEIVKFLLANGADAAQEGLFGDALQAASACGPLGTVRYLLENGVDVNRQAGEFGNALQVASAQGRLDIVRVLLDNGADVNAKGGKYRTALQAAAQRSIDECHCSEEDQKRYKDCIAILRQYGAEE